MYLGDKIDDTDESVRSVWGRQEYQKQCLVFCFNYKMRKSWGESYINSYVRSKYHFKSAWLVWVMSD